MCQRYFAEKKYLEIFIVGQLGLKRFFNLINEGMCGHVDKCPISGGETKLKCLFITDSCESTRKLSTRSREKEGADIVKITAKLC